MSKQFWGGANRWVKTDELKETWVTSKASKNHKETLLQPEDHKLLMKSFILKVRI